MPAAGCNGGATLLRANLPGDLYCTASGGAVRAAIAAAAKSHAGRTVAAAALSLLPGAAIGMARRGRLRSRGHRHAGATAAGIAAHPTGTSLCHTGSDPPDCSQLG